MRSGPLRHDGPLLLISAAEASSDLHGAKLLEAIRRRAPGVRAFGIGGPALRAAGLEVVVDARELLSMGFSEVLGRLPRILSALARIEGAARARRPDLMIVIDYPDFHFRLARRLRGERIPALYYIPPKVWVWRSSRVRALRELFGRVLTIFPFESEFYRTSAVPFTYVGNPLLDELPLGRTRAQARDALGLAAAAPALALLPGSRPAEVRRHLELMLDAAVRAAAVLRQKGTLGAETRLVVGVAFPETAARAEMDARVAAWVRKASGANPKFILDVRVSFGTAHDWMLAADAGLIKSGTSTLEAALLGCPHAIVYKTPWLTDWIFRYFIRYTGPVGLTNLVHGEGIRTAPRLVRELICGGATEVALMGEVVRMLAEPGERDRQRAGFARVRAQLGATEGGPGAGSAGGASGPSDRAAQAALEMLSAAGQAP